MKSFFDATEPAPIVFGTVALGVPYGLARDDGSANRVPHEDEVHELVERALALGIERFDTAPAYGLAEARLGRALRGRAAVWTKVADGEPSASLDRSLVALERSSVELLQWHNWTADRLGDPNWVRAWGALQGDARTRRLGATTYGVADACAAVASGLFDVVQVEFNLLVQGVVDAVMASAAARRVEIAVRSVFLQGALTDEGRVLPALPILKAGVEACRRVAAGTGLTRLALRFALDHPGIQHVLVGFDRLVQLEEAMKIVSGPGIPEDVMTHAQALDLRGERECDPRNWR